MLFSGCYCFGGDALGSAVGQLVGHVEGRAVGKPEGMGGSTNVEGIGGSVLGRTEGSGMVVGNPGGMTQSVPPSAPTTRAAPPSAAGTRYAGRASCTWAVVDVSGAMFVDTAGAAEATGGTVATSSPPEVVFMELHPNPTGGVQVVARAMNNIFFWRVMVRPSLSAGAFGVPLALLGVAAGPTHCRRKADSPIVSPTASDEVVQFMGRFDTSDPSGPRFAWSASAVSARFSGSSMSVRLHDSGNNQFQVVVDGRPTGVIATGASRELYPVVSGLASGEHDVAISKRTEANLGEVQFLGFVPGPDGALVPVPARGHARRIEFVGDSITAGFGDEGTTPTCPFSPATENESATYGAVTARNLGAEHTTIAWSGKTIDGMAQLYERTLPARSSSHWDFAQWVPDVVVVNLGVNDFFQGEVRQPVFTTAYISLLGRIRSHYPRALIVCALGPMLADTYPPGAMNLTRARRFIQASIDAVHAKGDSRVSFVEFPPQDPMTSGCGFHPNVRTHQQMAQQLTAQLINELGW